MISFLRRIIGSKLGAAFGLLFLALVAFAFAAGDISNQGGLGSLTDGGASTKIGGETLTEKAVTDRVQRAFEQQRRESPGLRIGDFLAMGAVKGVYDQLVAALALNEFATDQGMHVSKRMIDAEIAAIPAFHDASGKFSQNQYRQLLAERGLSDAALREDITQQLNGRLLIGPATLGAQLGKDLVLPYASLLLEAREGRIAAIPSVAFKPERQPTDQELKAFYTRNADRYTIPEQRRLRYAVVDAERFAAAANPTESEIAKYYADNKAKYTARETRTIEQLILPTESAAQAAAKAASLSAAAQANGLAVAVLDAKQKDAFADNTSQAAADAVFAAPQGKLVGPVKLPLGWALFQTRAIQRTAETPLAQAKPEIVAALTAQKQKTLLADFTAKIEDEIADGATFDEVVKDHGLATETTPALLASGQSIAAEGFVPKPDITPLLEPAFDMDADDDPQFVAVAPDKRYALLDVTDIIAPAPPPLEKVKPVVVQHYLLNQGAAKAKALADRLRAEIEKGKPFDKALAEAGVALPPAQTVAGRRADLLRGDKRPPAEISILFAMAQGSVKLMPIPEDQGWFLILLNRIQPGDAAKVPGLTDRVRDDMNGVVAGEYGDQFGQAIERALDVKPNPALLNRVTQELRRINGATTAQ